MKIGFSRHFIILITAFSITVQLIAAEVLPGNPILFVTQVPQPSDFATVTALFGNHRGTMESAPRGGGLWIRYADGTLRNLTAAAGFGLEGAQHTNGIAVREPTVHWDGEKAVFSMVVGAPAKQYEVKDFYWQLYEISNFGQGQTPVITKVSNQPTNYNNVSPCYGTDDRIIFASDRPRDGQRHLYPQLDEYEETPVVTGLWSLDPATGDLFMMNHSPSGVFSPSVDSFGRVIFSRWDHLQRDQQADADNAQGGNTYGTFNYSDESATALVLTNNRAEVFPERRQTEGVNNGHRFNQFFPWQINEDGTEEETINHVGRQELGGSYRSASVSDDPNVVELYYFGNKPNTNLTLNFIQLRESPVTPGLIYAIDAPEFGTHAAGQIQALEAHIKTNADFVKLHYLTPRATASALGENSTPTTNHIGLFRNPLPLSNGGLVAVHTAEPRADRNIGTPGAPRSRYDFRIVLMKQTNDMWYPDMPLTPGISNNVTWWAPDYLVTYNGPLWELDPVEVISRPRPSRIHPKIETPEKTVFDAEGVQVQDLQRYLKQRDLALIIGRNVTTRDAGDKQQPYNLRVPGGVETIGSEGKIYNVSHLQLFQADLIRGIGLRQNSSPRSGRRVLAQHMHDPVADNPVVEEVPSSVKVASDGSFAAFVPARRAMTWQLTGSNGVPVVRERYWVTFQPGEIRMCASCHGVNRHDQAGNPSPTNSPLALQELLRHWKTNNVPTLTRHEENGEEFLAMTFKRQQAASNLLHKVEVSEDLVTWVTGSKYSGSTNVPETAHTKEVSRSNGSFETITVRDTAPLPANSKRFFRLSVEREK
ncbi:MAG: hypothetical protein SFY81_01815 [Verrucomicrobiota bacterium]|nr:hypothetical protein [Verrucomicrobiota bacterium]